MIRKYGIPIGSVCILLGVLLLWIGAIHSVRVIVDGIPFTVQTRALTVGGLLRSSGLQINTLDQVTPSAGSLAIGQDLVIIERNRDVQVIVEPGGTRLNIESTQRIPGNLLLQAGVLLFPGDRILVNGMQINAADVLTPAMRITLQLRQAVEIGVQDGASSHDFYSSAFTLGQALEEERITFDQADSIDPASDTLLTRPLSVVIRRATRMYVSIGEQVIEAASSAATVGEALAESGLALQEIDRCLPAEDEPLPADGIIQVTRVTEVLELQQTAIPYGSDFIPDPNTEIDQRSVVTPGQYGIRVSRVRIRYEDGVENYRQTDAEWVAAEPVDEQLGYGTRIEIRTLDTPNGPIEYWRAVNVFATAYSPCRSGVDRCLYGTSSGMPVARGTIGVTRAWYNLMVGQQLYVPGYGVGTIGDTGGGYPGRYWIDLAFTDDDFEGWANWVTVYFLTPVPDNPIYILP